MINMFKQNSLDLTFMFSFLLETFDNMISNHSFLQNVPHMHVDHFLDLSFQSCFHEFEIVALFCAMGSKKFQT